MGSCWHGWTGTVRLELAQIEATCVLERDYSRR
jgi:hypothetical protein